MEENTKSLLLEDEEILWQGKPNYYLFTSADRFMIPSSTGTFIIFLLLRFLLIPMLMDIDFPLAFHLMYALLIFVGFYQFILRFFVKSYVYKRMEYIVTNKRVLEIRNFNKAKVEEVKIKEIGNYHIVIKENKSKVVFGEMLPFSFLFENTYAYPRFTYNSYNKPPLGFYDLDIEDAEKVYKIVSKIKSSL